MKHWWHRWFRTPHELSVMGVMGINMRNARFLLPNNPRHLYQRVDDKLITKALAEERGLEVPQTYLVVKSPHDVATMEQKLSAYDSFVMKPARGSGGKGVMVIDHRDGDFYVKPSGSRLSGDELRHHAENILAGLFSLGGNRDHVLIEYRVIPTQILTAISFQGAPDIRIVMLHGYPVMAMLRAATKESDGRANLHQGAIGIGIDLASGLTVRAVHHGSMVDVHPDLKTPLIGVRIPFWEKILEIAVTCHEMTELGYLGVDLMVVETRGPLMIEVNARPGLAIQMANGIGLMKRLQPVVDRHQIHPTEKAADRISFSREFLKTIPADS
jgi:alpha-L-glutamate ligase-like protein